MTTQTHPSTQARPGRYFAPAFCLILLIIGADQYTKWLVMETMLRVQDAPAAFADWFLTRADMVSELHGGAVFRTVTLTPWLDFVMVWNQGISFGLLDAGGEHMTLAFIALSLTVSLLLVIWLALSRRGFVSAALALVAGGALANIIDRVRFGAVADFIDIHAGNLHWPAFNLADSCIVAGALLLALDALLDGGKNKTGKTT